MEELSPQTRSINLGRPSPESDAPFNPPIVLSSTYHAGGAMGYGRYGNQTWSALEDVISSLEGGQTVAFSSGMAAISAVFTILPVGARVIASHQGYSGTMALLRELNASERLRVDFVDLASTEQALAKIDGADLLWLESPTNPMLAIADLPTLIAEAKGRNVRVGVDNTFATPLNQNPLSMGADVVAHSVTKYLAGHSDLLMGSLSTGSKELHDHYVSVRSRYGAIPGAFEAWLALRGIRTFVMRFEKASANAIDIARRLEAHPHVTRVHFPGLESHPGHHRAKSFMKGFGAVISFEIAGGADDAEKVTASSQLIGWATSLGGVESLWERRRRWPAESESVPENLIRLSVGCEGVEDLWRDIDVALRKALS